ncbi:hypothetical protein EDD11_008715, partial [Mortierella claussenii]
YSKRAVFENNAKIDFIRLIPKSFPNEPELKLSIQGKEDTTASQIVRAINRFLREFRDFYKLHLSGLFEILASQYMMKAFRKTGIEQWTRIWPPQLESVTEAEAPTSYDYSSINTWYPVERCVRELFRVNLFKAEAVKQVFALDTSTFTDVHLYAGKVENCLKNPAYEAFVLESLFSGLPDEGQKAVTAKYPKLADLPNVAMFLNCVRADSTRFSGRKTDWAKWFRSRFKILGVGIQAPSPAATAKKVATLQFNKGKHEAPP